MSKILFFFTSSYPFGQGETFIENEIHYLAEAFDKIIIVSNNCDDTPTRNIPDNCLTVRFPYEINKIQTLLSLLGFFSPEFWKEFRIINKVYNKRVNPVILKTMLVSLQKSKVFSKHIKKLFHGYSSPADSLYCYSYWANDTAFALSQIKRYYPQVKMITRAHGWDAYFEANRANYLPFRKPILHGLDRIFFISQKGFDYYHKLLPELTHKMEIARLGVPQHAAKEPNLESEKLQIVSCSNVIPLKRIHLIPEALSVISDIPVEWAHWGTGSAFENLQSHCLQLLSDKSNITYHLTGYVANDRVISFYLTHAANLFINVSSTEGIPVSIMEAMSFGIPVIASDVGGTAEIVKKGYNGFLLSTNPSPEEIAEAIRNFYFLSLEEKQRMRENAYKTWEEEYNAEKNYKAFTKKILSL